MGRTAQVSIGAICTILLVGSVIVAIEDARLGNWFSLLLALVSIPVFAIGAVGGLLGPERLPEKSIADLFGWHSVSNALNRPLRDWFTPGRARR